MKVRDPYFKLERVRKYLDEDIYPSRVRDVLILDDWKYKETSMEDKIDDAYYQGYDDSSWSDFHLMDSWGGYDKVAWFRHKVNIPEEFLGKQIAFKGIIGPRDGGGSTAETLLYINGKPIQAIDIWHEEAFLDAAVYENSQELQISLKSWSGVLNIPRVRVFKDARLFTIDTRVDKFYHTADTLEKCINLLEENDLRRIRLTRLLMDTFKIVDFLNYKEEPYYSSIYKALEYLQEGLNRYYQVDEIKPTITCVGHSHIDMGWLWRYCATREKASRTFATVLNLMRIFPEYRFMHSSPQLYKFIKEDYPIIFEQIKDRIKEGRWEITGGMWVEADTNLPSGESLVRQFLFGKRYIKEEFGKDSKLLWLPDVFGYSGALPQIMKKCDIDYFMTTKISWNQYNHFPFDTFLWKGIDGSEVFTHFITTPEDAWYYTYNGTLQPKEITGIWQNYKDKDKNDELLLAYGWGDGGGGPTREMLERAHIMKNIPGIPKVKLDTAENYFKRIYDNIDHSSLNIWDGELYFEMHRGTYTSQGYTKRANRRAEILLHNAEFLNVLADTLSGQDNYPQLEINALWEQILLNQFHDVLPGSSIRQVYEDAKAIYEDVQNKGIQLTDKAMQRICETVPAVWAVQKGTEGRAADQITQTADESEVSGQDSLVIFNTLGWERNDIVSIPLDDKRMNVSFTDALGRSLMKQITDDQILLYTEDIPAYGYKKVFFTEEKGCQGYAPAEKERYKELTVSNKHLENQYFNIELNDNGEIISFIDKRKSRQICCGKPMNVLCAFEDKPLRFDAWDIDAFYREKPYGILRLVNSEVLETGPVRASLRLIWKFNESFIQQDMLIYRDKDRIDFKTFISWKEKQVLLKAFFPVDVHAAYATYDIQYGNIQRPTHSNTEWDFAKFEVCAHKWVDLSEGFYGVSLLNDCKYGYDIHGNVIGISLIKSAVSPDETADRCDHHFTYSIYPHSGSWQASEVQRSAMELNVPLLFKETGINGFIKPSYGFAEVISDHVMIDTIKRAEDEKAYIIRLYEYKNNKSREVKLRFHCHVNRVVETNLMERELWDVDIQNDEIGFDISGYEIKTYKIYC